MSADAITVSTMVKWLFILIVAVFTWEMARNLWANWGTSNFWVSSLVAALVGMLLWWGIGLVAYLSTPKTISASPTTPPASVQQSAVVSGGSTNVQAGRDVTVNQGPSVEDVRKLLKDEMVNRATDFANKYPHGYVIFGATPGGPLIWETKLRNIKIDTKWDSLRFRVNMADKTIQVNVPSMVISFPDGREPSRSWNNVENLWYEDNKPIASVSEPGMYYELLDFDRHIFLVGFK